MAPLERNPLWIVPVLAMSFFMVYAMMLLVMSYFATSPRRKKPPPSSAAEFKARLLALNGPERPFNLEPATNRDFNLKWRVVDAKWYELFARVWLNNHYTVRLLLDEGRHVLRMHESLRSTYFFVGIVGWRLRIQFGLTYYAGLVQGRYRGKAWGLTRLFPPKVGEVYDFDLDTPAVKQLIYRAALESGWGVKPVIWWFEASRWGKGIGRLLIPPLLNRWPPKKLWGVLYPVSYVATMVWIAFVAGIEITDWRNIGIMAVVSAIWWGATGLIVGVLILTSRPRRRKRAKSFRPHV